VDKVAGGVVNSLIRGRTLQRINSADLENFSRFVWNNRRTSAHPYTLPAGRSQVDILQLISAEDCEDALGLYLQKHHGYAIIPGTCKSDTAAYEYVLTHRETGDKAVVQVKQGSSYCLRATDYLKLSEDNNVYLFSTTESYDREGGNDRIHFVRADDIRNFLREESGFIGDRLATWVRWEREVGGGS
jgi:hypothetical protein